MNHPTEKKKKENLGHGVGDLSGEGKYFQCNARRVFIEETAWLLFVTGFKSVLKSSNKSKRLLLDRQCVSIIFISESPNMSTSAQNLFSPTSASFASRQQTALYRLPAYSTDSKPITIIFRFDKSHFGKWLHLHILLPIFCTFLYSSYVLHIREIFNAAFRSFRFAFVTGWLHVGLMLLTLLKKAFRI